jgi:hypothetical protein
LQRGEDAGTRVERDLALGAETSHDDGDAFASERMRHDFFYMAVRRQATA